MRKTKIICTIGPACSDEETLRKMCLAGMNVARLNFSHGTHRGAPGAASACCKRCGKNWGSPVAIMLDTKGPEYRIGRFADGKVDLKAKGEHFTLTTEDVPGDQQARLRNLQRPLRHELAARRPGAGQQRPAGA